jgi:tRNA nucleotidyltransferase/poly(A) polymerase
MALMPAELAEVARGLAVELQAAGHRAWVVGGAVRDLALDVVPADIDLASAARPEELERLFPASHSVGRAFGTVVVRRGRCEVQVTTFRSETGYDDARRPSRVDFAASLEQDATRRDFTCNALYLDPLADELRDPVGGWEDLRAGLLRCVGEPRARFREDGLRILRLARLSAAHGLAVEEGTREGARDSLEALRGVSPERVLGELTRMARSRDPGAALSLLLDLGALQRLPGLGAASPAAVAALARLPEPNLARVFALLFHPAPGAPHGGALEALAHLRAPRALSQRVEAIWRHELALEAALQAFETGDPPRSRWVPLVRAEEHADAEAVHAALRPGHRVGARARLAAARADLTPAELRPSPLVTSAELARAGIPRGPRWAELLREGEALQLDGHLRTAEEARAWLAGQQRPPDQVGGSARRKA